MPGSLLPTLGPTFAPGLRGAGAGGGAVAPPGTPTIGTATTTAGNTASVTFTPGAPAGTNYRAISTPGGLTGNATSSPITVSGLTTGVDYTFTVRAENAGGNSAESGASNSIRGARGAELLTNGAFAADTNWTKGTGWTIVLGIAEFAGVSGGAVMSQAVSGPSSVTYEITFTVLNWVAGTVTAELVGGTTVAGTARGASGTYTQQLTAPATFATFQFNGSLGADIDVDNVSLRQVI